MARAAIYAHLREEVPKKFPHIQVMSFKDIRSRTFEQYRAGTPLHFAMVHDGARENGKVKKEGAETLLRCLIYHFHTIGLNVALTNFVEFRDWKVFTMVSESSTTKHLAADVWAKMYAISLSRLHASSDSGVSVIVDDSQLFTIQENLSRNAIDA
jgi:hypothetical protein